jgi:nitroreductase
MPTDIDAAVAEAVLAPSSHNTQPWLFERADGRVRLYADRTRALPVNDPEDRELTISCGAALFTLRVAAAGQGSGTRVTLLPDGEASDLLAEVVFEGAPEAELAALAPAIGARHTHRGEFDEAPVGAATVAALADAAAAEGAALEQVADYSRRAALADLVSEGDAAQWADARWRRELAMWMHPRRAGDGLSMPGAAVPMARFAVRHFDMGARIGAQDAEFARAAPAVVVLGTPGDAERDWLVAGMALARVLLVAAGAGIQAGYLNQPLQVAALRMKLKMLAEGAGMPQAVLRLGHPKGEPSAAPRRAVSEVLIP